MCIKDVCSMDNKVSKSFRNVCRSIIKTLSNLNLRERVRDYIEADASLQHILYKWGLWSYKKQCRRNRRRSDAPYNFRASWDEYYRNREWS